VTIHQPFPVWNLLYRTVLLSKTAVRSIF